MLDVLKTSQHFYMAFSNLSNCCAFKMISVWSPLHIAPQQSSAEPMMNHDDNSLVMLVPTPVWSQNKLIISANTSFRGFSFIQDLTVKTPLLGTY